MNAIAPGPFPRPEFLQNFPDLYEALVNKVPMNRLGSPEELIGPVVFLASNASSFVNGTTLSVDGGWTAW